MEVNTSSAGAWWILVFAGLLVLAALVPLPRPSQAKEKGDHRPGKV